MDEATLEALGSGPDIDNIDIKSMDRGDGLELDTDEVEDDAAPAEKPAKPAAKPAVKEAAADEATDEADAEEGDAEDETEETVEEPEAIKPGKFAKKSEGIPKARFDEAVNKERLARETAESRVRALEAQISQTQTEAQARVTHSAQIKALDESIEALTEKYNDLLIGGEKEEANKVMAEIRKSERAVANMEAEQRAGAIVNKTLELERTKLAVAKLEADYPIVNPASEQYDDDVVQMILLMQGRLIATENLAPSAAMAAAAERVMTKLKLNTPAADEAEGDTADEAEEKAAETKRGLSDKKVEERKAATIARARAAAKAQLPDTSITGLDSDKLGAKALPDITKLSADQYDALPASTKARLRGDTL
jgi:hypothetical protein